MDTWWILILNMLFSWREKSLKAAYPVMTEKVDRILIRRYCHILDEKKARYVEEMPRENSFHSICLAMPWRVLSVRSNGRIWLIMWAFISSTSERWRRLWRILTAIVLIWSHSVCDVAMWGEKMLRLLEENGYTLWSFVYFEKYGWGLLITV